LRITDSGQCSIHPYLFADAIPNPYELGEHLIDQSGKFLVLKKLVQHYVAVGTKVIVFSNFDQALNLCEDLVMMLQGSNRAFEYARLDGRTTGPWRKVMVYLFQNDPRYKVFLISIRAGGEGLNLTSSSVIVFLDEDWNPQVMRQAEARVHRIGQTRPVVIYKLRSTGTVEEQMSRRLIKKAYITDRVTDSVHTHCPRNENRDVLKSEEVRMSQNSTDSFGLPSPVFVDQAFLSHRQIDTDEMAQWDMNTILNKCSSTQRDGGHSGCLTVEQEQHWLEKADRVRTDLFNGVTIDTSGRHHTVYAEEEGSNLLRSNRRIGKERTVMIDGYAVSKESLSPSVENLASTSEECASTTNTFTHQLVSRDPIRVTSHANRSQTCFLCHQFNAEDCDKCPRAFHTACLESVIEEEHPSSGTSICPHHYCWKCHKNASEAGRLLFCCRRCVRAFCDECFYWDTTTLVGANPAYEALGYFSKNAFFIDCLICKCHEKRKHASETEGYSGKRRKVVGRES
jgi:SWI/SNF-related matrix-associated actin-dependent regulator of chromatin subfamily A member 5